MTSMLRSVKQVPTNNGYYVTLANCSAKMHDLTGSDTDPKFAVTAVFTGGALTTISAAAGGAILRDEGKTLRSANRVFRKVQLLVSTGSVLAGGSDGVAGVAGVSPNTGYLTAYIELPGPNVTAAVTPVARLG